jgi:pyruvate/2-oxoglutarate dehydrogenase complex dihydrolipoamide acyltransferase (E2) component
MIEVILGNLPSGTSEAMIQAWYFEEGDAVQKGDEIAELTTEEGPVTITAPTSGILSEVYYDEGESVERGEVLCLIESDEEHRKGGAGEIEEEEE